MSEWIDVKDRLPESDSPVFVHFPDGTGDGSMGLAFYFAKDRRFTWPSWAPQTDQPTHWMPVPAPPEQE